METNQETMEETEPAEDEDVKESAAEKQEEKKSGNILPAMILLAAVVIGEGLFCKGRLLTAPYIENIVAKVQR